MSVSASSATATATVVTATSSTATTNVEPPAGYNRSACTECQRRKQKCNREWPCDRCQRRKIADECRYNYCSNNTPSTGGSAGGNHTVANTSSATLPHPIAQDNASVKPPSHSQAPRSEAKSSADNPGFDALAATRLFTTLGIEPKAEPSKLAPKEDFAAPDSSPQIERVLQLLPSRQIMDKLVRSFTHDINYHYYIIYPPDFLRDYHIWWERRSKGRQITLQYTCLLAMICACCVQHAEAELQPELERASGMTADVLSEKLHCAVRELGSVIPVGRFHLLNVQRLLHSCYWYKAEARFLEAWHVLSAAILEAKELAYHKEPPQGTETEHEREMRRRLWCILDTWDWQISSGLSRPKIINREDCNAELPSLTLERFSGQAPSPLLHMKMQSALTRQLASRFSAPKNIINPSEVLEYQALIEAWIVQFPRVYQLENPDMSKDSQFPWVFPHRYYVNTMACLLILNPIRHYMVRPYASDAPPEELSIRATGVFYSLKLMTTLRSWVDKIHNRDGRLHFVVFSIFDTAAILCTAVIKDNDHMLAGRDEILYAIGDAVAMLQCLNRISKTSRTSYHLLERLVRRLPLPTAPRQSHARKKAKMASSVARPAPKPSVVAPAPLHGVVNIPGGTAPAAGYGSRFGALPAPLPILRSNYVAPPPTSGPVDDGRAHPDYSTGSEDTPPSMNDPMKSSFSAVSDPNVVPTQGPTQPIMGRGGNHSPAAAEGDANDFELETVTQAQLGELAPLWNWHSENLNFANVGNGGASGAGFVPPATPTV